jgi:hypothetical protein
MRKARVWRAFLIERRKFSGNKNGWLGREGSNLRMAESNPPPSGSAITDLSAAAALINDRAHGRIIGV